MRKKQWYSQTFSWIVQECDEGAVPISGLRSKRTAAAFNFRLQIIHRGDNGLYEHMLQGDRWLC
jgi:hypothetical protein